ncbi:MAG TPA: GGDEF domain-containing protein [Pirellulaceae bacterium]|nr:GGDEF domain-containing protein [Pirellulaceae bacterium]HMO91956.1 GGDEF domain-containing protein [Pirellulaceae bacterium]HMP68755.1 GGDEF domain-containing protein [Pirellulaceae bacterium]
MPLNSAVHPIDYTVEQFANTSRLPTIPEVALRLLQIAQQQDPDYDEICRVIRSDPAISGKILKTVNSALFAFRQKIETIEESVPKLGLTLLRTIVLSFYLSRHDQNDARLQPVLQDHWRSSLTQAVFAELIAARLRYADPEQCFLAAMLQDIGILAMLSEAPDAYLDHVLEFARFPNVLTAEYSFFGFSHVQVSALILERWGLSESFGNAILQHHDRVTMTAQTQKGQLAIVLQAANQGAELLLSNRGSQSPFTAAVEEWANFLHTKLGVNGSQADEIISEVVGKVNEYRALFNFDIGSGVCPDRVIFEAKMLLQEIALNNQMELIRQSKMRTTADMDELVYRDSLSGLYNRRYLGDVFANMFEKSIKRRESVAAIYIDVDKFKPINDAYGHSVGDQTIQHVAKWLGRSIRRQDLAFRLGGDEFLVILQNIKLQDLQSVAARISHDMPPLETPDGRIVPISLSTGCVYYLPEQGDSVDPNWLIDEADHSMYKSKRNGGKQLTLRQFIGRQKELDTH